MEKDLVSLILGLGIDLLEEYKINQGLEKLFKARKTNTLGQIKDFFRTRAFADNFLEAELRKQEIRGGLVKNVRINARKREVVEYTAPDSRMVMPRDYALAKSLMDHIESRVEIIRTGVDSVQFNGYNVWFPDWKKEDITNQPPSLTSSCLEFKYENRDITIDEMLIKLEDYGFKYDKFKLLNMLSNKKINIFKYGFVKKRTELCIFPFDFIPSEKALEKGWLVISGDDWLISREGQAQIVHILTVERNKKLAAKGEPIVVNLGY
jgi:hypothetical protein